MAISWDTRLAIPRMNTYADALDHYNKVKPIARDNYEPRPCGRRDQPWFTIWQEADKSIAVGYGRKELSSRRALLRWTPSGVIEVVTDSHYTGASCQERMQRMTGCTFQTYYYDTWVRSHYYENGVLTDGWLPIRKPAKRYYSNQGDNPPATSQFARVGDKLVYLNYRYPVRHVLDKQGISRVREQYAAFESFITGVTKLCDGRLSFSDETVAEVFGWSDVVDRNGKRYPNYPDNLRYYRANVEQVRADFMERARSADPDDHLRAAIQLVRTMYYSDVPQKAFEDLLFREHRDEVFATEEVRTGALVRDRYKEYFRLT